MGERTDAVSGDDRLPNGTVGLCRVVVVETLPIHYKAPSGVTEAVSDRDDVDAGGEDTAGVEHRDLAAAGHGDVDVVAVQFCLFAHEGAGHDTAAAVSSPAVSAWNRPSATSTTIASQPLCATWSISFKAMRTTSSNGA